MFLCWNALDHRVGGALHTLTLAWARGAGGAARRARARLRHRRAGLRRVCRLLRRAARAGARVRARPARGAAAVRELQDRAGGCPAHLRVQGCAGVGVAGVCAGRLRRGDCDPCGFDVSHDTLRGTALSQPRGGRARRRLAKSRVDAGNTSGKGHGRAAHQLSVRFAERSGACARVRLCCAPACLVCPRAPG
jgi:hypothetical protein